MWGNVNAFFEEASAQVKEKIKHSLESDNNNAATAASHDKNDNDDNKDGRQSEGSVADNISTRTLSDTWTKMVNSTKSTISATKKVLEDEIQQIQIQIPSIHMGDSIRERDVSLPLDAAALQDAEVVYITDRIISMRHPGMQSDVDGDLTATRKLAAVSHLLKKRHRNHFMICNLSEMEYDSELFDYQVLAYKFPGSPSPPLGLLMNILLGVESWLKADQRNVVVFHCLTGKGRTSIVIAALLCWVGECGFSNMNDALTYIASCKRQTVDALTIPSQRRYLNYVTNMLDGVRPHQPPIILKRVTMSDSPCFEPVPINEAVGFVLNEDVPSFEPVNTASKVEGEISEDKKFSKTLNLMGCAPYLQIFKDGQLLYTTCLSSDQKGKRETIPWCVSSNCDQQISKKQSLTFPVECAIQGDILIRCRHMRRSGERVSMLRISLHTGYIIAPKVLRLTKAEIDGACTDNRIPKDFYVDLVFEMCDAERASQFMRQKSKEVTQSESDKEETMSGVITPKSSFDAMLYNDEKLWNAISKRQKEIVIGQSNSSKTVGATVGRIRDIGKVKILTEQKTSESNRKGVKTASPFASGVDAFSIGEHIGFNFESSKEEDIKPKPRERDELLEALNAIEVPSPDKKIHESEEEITFHTIEKQEENENVSTITDTPRSDIEKASDKSEINSNTRSNNAVDDANNSEVESSGINEEEIDLDLVDIDFDDSDLENIDDDDASLEDLEEFLTRTK